MLKFYKCDICGEIIELVVDRGVVTSCCGQKMKELIPNTTDGAGEKHVPVVKVEGNLVNVCVGEVVHPQTEAHLINFIVLETNLGVYRKTLAANGEPVATFALSEGEEVKNCYAYCNLHGLWKCL